MTDFFNNCISSPFSFLYTQLLFLRDRAAQIVVTLLPFFNALLAEMPIFDWGLLSPYEKTPNDTVGTSLPQKEYLYLIDISLYQEFLSLFLLIFDEYITKNRQFEFLAQSVFTEYSSFKAAPSIFIPVKDLITITKDPSVYSLILQDFDKAVDNKYRESHLNRMRQLNFLLGDLDNLSSLSFDEFLRCIYQTKAALAFAEYEVEIFFRITDKEKWDEVHIKSIGPLLHLLDQHTLLLL